MSSSNPQPSSEIRDLMAQLPDAHHSSTESFGVEQGDGATEKIIDAIEMIGEEKAAGFGASQVTPGMRYLHSSRTIHQLVTDRNRAVGIFLAVASLLLTASGAIFHANPQGALIIPIGEMQRWCFPVTFATLAILAVLMSFLLIRTRIGLIYEVAKMNALLGLPIGRVQRVSPLSIHFILQLLVTVAGGIAAGAFSVFMIRLSDPEAIHRSFWIGAPIGLAVVALLLIVDFVTVKYTTADHRLHRTANNK